MFVVACRPGTYSVDGLTPCKQCPLGTYQSDYGRTLCLPCGPGIMTSDVGATGFQDCIVKGLSFFVATTTLVAWLTLHLILMASFMQ